MSEEKRTVSSTLNMNVGGDAEKKFAALGAAAQDAGNKIVESNDKAVKAGQRLTAVFDRKLQSVDKVYAAEKRLQSLMEQYEGSIKDVVQGEEQHAQILTMLTGKLNPLAQMLEGVKRKYDSNYNAMRTYGDEMSRVSRLLDALNVDEAERARILKMVDQALDPATASMRQYAAETARARSEVQKATQAELAKNNALEAQRRINELLGVTSGVDPRTVNRITADNSMLVQLEKEAAATEQRAQAERELAAALGDRLQAEARIAANQERFSRFMGVSDQPGQLAGMTLLAEMEQNAAAQESETRAIREKEEALKRMNQALLEAARAQNMYNQFTNVDQQSSGRADATLLAEQMRAADALDKELQQLRSSSDQFALSQEKLAERLQRINQLMQQGALSPEAGQRMIRNTNAQIEANKRLEASYGQVGEGARSAYQNQLIWRSSLVNTFQSIAAGQPIMNTLWIQSTQAIDTSGKLNTVTLALGVTFAIAAAAALGFANAIARSGDEANRARGRMGALMADAAAAREIYADLQAIGRETGVSANEASGTFSRFFISTREIGATRRELTEFTEIIQKLGIASGATSQELIAGMRQLSQGLGSGKLAGDELRSVLENLPLVARLIAKEFGVSIDVLRELAADGEVTSDKVFKAILEGGKDANELFARMPITIERAAGQMGVAWDSFLTKLNDSYEISEKIVKLYQFAVTGMDAFGAALDNSPQGQLTRVQTELRQQQQIAGRQKPSLLRQALDPLATSASEIEAAQKRVAALKLVEQALEEVIARQQEEAAIKDMVEERDAAAAKFASDRARALRELRDLTEQVNKEQKLYNDYVKQLETLEEIKPFISPELFKDLEEGINGNYAEALKKLTKDTDEAGKKVEAALRAAMNKYEDFYAVMAGPAEQAANPLLQQAAELERVLTENNVSLNDNAKAWELVVNLRLAAGEASARAQQKVDGEAKALLRSNDVLEEQLRLLGAEEAVIREVRKQKEIETDLIEYEEKLRKSVADKTTAFSEREIDLLVQIRRELLENVAVREKEIAQKEKLEKLTKASSTSAGNVLTQLANEDFEGAGDGLEKMMEDFAALEKASGGTGEALSKLAQGMFESGEAAAILGGILGQVLNRSEAQNKNAKLGRQVGSMAGQAIGTAIGGPMGGQIGKFVGAVGGDLLGGSFGPSKAHLRRQQRSRELTAFGEEQTAFLEEMSGIVGLGAELAGLDRRFATIAAEARKLKQPLDQLTAAYERQRAKLIDTFNENISISVVEMTNEGLGGLMRLQAEQRKRFNEAIQGEADISKVRQLEQLELQRYMDTLNAKQLAALDGLIDAAEVLRTKVRLLVEEINNGIDKSVRAAEQLAQSAQQEAQALRQIAESMRQTLRGLTVGELSPLSPEQQLNELRSRFETLRVGASQNDQAALAALPAAAEELLAGLREFYASSPNYVQEFDRITGILAQLSVVTDVRATGLELIASLAEVQIEILQDIKEILATDLGANTSSALSAALADEKLTIGEAENVTNALDELGEKFATVDSESAKQVKDAIALLRVSVVAGNLTEAQKTAITDGQAKLASALETFKEVQIAEYTAALKAAGDAIGALEKFVLDPDGKIPAAVAAAFEGGWFNSTLTGRVENVFREAIGATQVPLTLNNRVFSLIGDAVGSAWTGPDLNQRTTTTFREAIGNSLTDTLSTRVSGFFGSSIGQWGAQPLVDRVNEVFAQVVGTPNWQVSLSGLMGANSALVVNIQNLTGQMVALQAALRDSAGRGSAQAMYDSQLQSFVSSIRSGAAAGSNMLLAVPFDEPSGSHNNRSNAVVDATTGAMSGFSGNHENNLSRQRRDVMAQALSQLARQIEVFTGGDIGSFEVSMGENGSGYRIGGADRLNAFGGNDFAGIGRAFVVDALNAVSGGNAKALEVLRKQDFSNISVAFAEAAREWFELNNAPRFAMGGDHTGGLRMVGERGWEVEATGPARYWNQNQLADVMKGDTDAVVQGLANVVLAVQMQTAVLQQQNNDTKKELNTLNRNLQSSAVSQLVS